MVWDQEVGGSNPPTPTSLASGFPERTVSHEACGLQRTICVPPGASLRRPSSLAVPQSSFHRSSTATSRSLSNAVPCGTDACTSKLWPFPCGHHSVPSTGVRTSSQPWIRLGAPSSPPSPTCLKRSSTLCLGHSGRAIRPGSSGSSGFDQPAWTHLIPAYGTANGSFLIWRRWSPRVMSPQRPKPIPRATIRTTGQLSDITSSVARTSAAGHPGTSEKRAMPNMARISPGISSQYPLRVSMNSSAFQTAPILRSHAVRSSHLRIL